MSSTFFTSERSGDMVFARLHCEKIAERESQVLQNELSTIAEQAGWKLALDMSEVGLLASVGLGALVTLQKKCKTGGGRMVVYSLSEDLVGVLKLSRFDRLITIVADRPAAEKALT